MNKPYVICHMYTSIDGKIDGNYMNEEGCNISGDYYDEKIFKVGTSMASGRVTTKLYKAKEKENLENYRAFENQEDYIIESEHYNFIFDRMGKCFYKDSIYSYGGKNMQIVEVVSSKCDRRYFSYLRSIKISYIIADSIEEALDKIYTKFKVKKLVLTGGAIINGGFLLENMIDEISLIVASYIEGNDAFKQCVGSMNKFVNQKFIFDKAIPLLDGGVDLTFKKLNGN